MLNNYLFKYLLILMMMQLILIIISIKNIHPLPLMLTLIIFSILTIMYNSMNNILSLYLYMIFISIIGGIMIMFLYFTSLINNYKMKIKKTSVFIFLFSSLMNIITIYMNFILPKNYFIEENLNSSMTSTISQIYLSPYIYLTYLSILYLFIVLMLVMKMCSTKFKPLRKMKN